MIWRRDRGRQVSLAHVQHVGARGEGDVGSVVDREQRSAPVAGRAEHLEEGELFPRLQALLPKLDDVDAALENGVEEGGQVTLLLPRIRTQVQPGGSEPRATGV